MKGYVALEDGTIFSGTSCGAEGESVGEVVFNTGLTGYQEVLTDPSYSSQIVTMTYPLIGNYGINPTDVESDKIQVSGFIVKEACKYPSNFTSTQTLPDYLKQSGIVCIEGIDTRALTRHLRVVGALKGIVATGDVDPKELVKKAAAWTGLVGVDIVANVTCAKPYYFEENPADATNCPYFVVAYDFGIKLNILRILKKLGCRILVVPASYPAEKVLELKSHGVFLSNGPGDPAAVTYAIENIKKLLGKTPLFGICLGQQLLSLALGGKTYKLKFGHRGLNHPVKNLATGSVEITTQNHGFCVDLDSLSSTSATITHMNLNDTTCEGIAVPELKAFSVQYHPEAAPGPHDSGYLFEQFISMMTKTK